MECSFAGKIKDVGMERGVGQGENSPCCLHALGLGQGTVKPPQGPLPVSFVKRQLAPLPSPSRARHGCDIQGEHRAHPSHAAGHAKGHPKRVCRTLSSPQEPCPQPTLWKWDRGMKDSRGNADPAGAGMGPDPGEQLLLELSGTEQGLPGLGSHCLQRQPITSPLSRGKEASVFILCRKKLLFHC